MGDIIKWKYKFQNFERAFRKLSAIEQIQNPGEIEKMALIQAFEYTFELAWKTMKDYLQLNGFHVASPRESIRTAYEAKYISNCDTWLDAIDIRNLSSHAYDDKILEETSQFILKRFFPVAEQFLKDFTLKSGVE